MTTILQPISHGNKDVESTPPPPPPKSKKSKSETAPEATSQTQDWIPPDAENDDGQLKVLSSVFDDGFANGSVGKGKKAGIWIVNGSVNLPGSNVKQEGSEIVKEENKNEDYKTNGEANHKGINGNGEMLPPPAPAPVAPSSESWKITDREVYYIAETGEIFTDYE